MAFPKSITPKATQGHPVEDEASEKNWHVALQLAYRRTDELFELLSIDPHALGAREHVTKSFPTLVPTSYLRRMRPGDITDPLLLQVLPSPEESRTTAGFSNDPVGDGEAHQAAGMLQKYVGRALLITTGACAVHCRYCFRRDYPYSEEPRRLDDWQPALNAIANDESLHEIILSGGDPLMLTDTRLRQLVELLAQIPHVRRLRVHSRMPIVLPSRVTGELISLLKETRLAPIMVVHANHGNELIDDCADALKLLVQSGIPTLNQAVLLNGINDNVDALAELCERSVELGVMPYYLHQLDRVNGAAHFEVPVEKGRELVRKLRERLPGYAVPKYVQEIAGEPYKTPL